jgi:ankyrin repeat protein
MGGRLVVGICLVGWCTVAVAGASSDSLALADAVKAGNRSAVRQLVNRHVTVNASAPDGTTPLHWAVRANDLEMSQVLLRAGANAAAANRYGVTPIALAATNGNAAMLELLVKAGADPNAALPEGETVLMTAARVGNVDALKVLLTHGAGVNATERWLGETSLMWAASENHGAAVRVLTAFGADVNARSALTAFPQLTWKQEGMATTVFPRGGWTPLMYAARQGAMEAVTALADVGADVNLTDPDGTTALVLAIINAHYDVAQVLLERGADPNLEDGAGMGALYAAIDTSGTEWLHNRPIARPSGTLQGADIVKALLAHGANANARLKKPILQKHHTPGDTNLGEGATPLMRAARASDVAVSRLLLENGADPAPPLKNHTTAFLIAAGLFRDNNLARAPWTEADAVKVLRLLLDRGAEVNGANDDGQTALHAAVARGENVDVLIQFLADEGADLFAINKRGQTALDVARGDSGSGMRRTRPNPAAAVLLSRLMGIAPEAATTASSASRQ